MGRVKQRSRSVPVTGDKGYADTKEAPIMSVAKYNGYRENNEVKIGDWRVWRSRGDAREGCAPS